MAAAKRFRGKALQALKDWEKPTVINTDKAPTHAAALAELKQDGRCPAGTQHRQVKCLNNVIEADHGRLKQPIRPVRGFKPLRTAYATIKGVEVMRALGKGQVSAFDIRRDIRGKARIVERACGLGASAPAEAGRLLDARLRVEAASTAKPLSNAAFAPSTKLCNRALPLGLRCAPIHGVTP